MRRASVRGTTGTPHRYMLESRQCQDCRRLRASRSIQHLCHRENHRKKRCADVYFTSIANNAVWLKLRITDETGNIFGETGLLKTDEYIKSIKFDTVPAAGTKIKLKIMAYEPETYYIAGAVTLNTTVGG